MDDGEDHEDAREMRTMGGNPAWRTTDGTRDPGGGRTRRHGRRAAGAGALVAAALTLAACSPGGGTKIQTPPTKQKSVSTTSVTTTSTSTSSDLPPGTASTQQAVLNTWVSAEQQLYSYADEPPAPLRADLVAGETSSNLFPKLTNYFTGSALQSEATFLVKLKMALLNGPTSYDLGTPSVTALTANTATVSFCTSDTGTTTANGQPGPLDLDGNDPGVGGVQGTSSIVLTSGSWMISSGQSTSVAKC